jgi:hypothetical protein
MLVAASKVERLGALVADSVMSARKAAPKTVRPPWLVLLVEAVNYIPEMSPAERARLIKKHGRELPAPVLAILAPKESALSSATAFAIDAVVRERDRLLSSAQYERHIENAINMLADNRREELKKLSRIQGVTMKEQVTMLLRKAFKDKLTEVSDVQLAKDLFCINPGLRKRLDSCAKGTGADPSDILRLGAKKVVEEWEAEGSVRFGSNFLRVSHKHEDAFKKWAEFLEVTPQQFLDWHHDDDTADLEDPMGILSSWVHDMLVYDTKASERRVKARMRALDLERNGHPMKHDRPGGKATGRKGTVQSVDLFRVPKDALAILRKDAARRGVSIGTAVKEAALTYAKTASGKGGKP